MQLCADGETKMKKAEKIELAEKCFKKIKELNLTATITGFWIVLPPTTPKEIFMDMAKCDTEHLIKLIKNDSTQSA